MATNAKDAADTVQHELDELEITTRRNEHAVDEPTEFELALAALSACNWARSVSAGVALFAARGLVALAST